MTANGINFNCLIAHLQTVRDQHLAEHPGDEPKLIVVTEGPVESAFWEISSPHPEILCVYENLYALKGKTIS